MSKDNNIPMYLTPGKILFVPMSVSADKALALAAIYGVDSNRIQYSLILPDNTGYLVDPKQIGKL